MNITEANAVNTLLRLVLGDADDEAAVGAAREASVLLANRAHRALSAGLTGAEVEARFDWDLYVEWGEEGPAWRGVEDVHLPGDAPVTSTVPARHDHAVAADAGLVEP